MSDSIERIGLAGVGSVNWTTSDLPESRGDGKNLAEKPSELISVRFDNRKATSLGSAERKARILEDRLLHVDRPPVSSDTDFSPNGAVIYA